MAIPAPTVKVTRSLAKLHKPQCSLNTGDYKDKQNETVQVGVSKSSGSNKDNNRNQQSKPRRFGLERKNG